MIIIGTLEISTKNEIFLKEVLDYIITLFNKEKLEVKFHNSQEIFYLNIKFKEEIDEKVDKNLISFLKSSIQSSKLLWIYAHYSIFSKESNQYKLIFAFKTFEENRFFSSPPNTPNEPVLPKPQYNQISKKYFNQIGDYSFLIYTASTPKDIFNLEEFKLHLVNIFLKNKEQKYDLEGHLRVFKNNSAFAYSYKWKGTTMWQGLYLYIESSDLDTIKAKIKEDYEKRGYEVADIIISENEK